MINSAQVDYAREKALADEVEKVRVAGLEQQIRARLALKSAEAALAAKKSRDIVAQGLGILMEESASAENPISKFATQSYVDEHIGFLARWLFGMFRRQS